MVILLFLGMVATELVYVKVVNLSLRDCKTQDARETISSLISLQKIQEKQFEEKKQVVETYRLVFNRPAPLPDVERLHPADLVGSYSR